MTPAHSEAIAELDRAINRCRISGIGADLTVRLGYEEACEIRKLVDEQKSELEELRPAWPDLAPATD